MIIKREDIDRRNVDFSDVSTRGRLPPIHPGDILREEFLEPMNLSVCELANALHVPRSRVNYVVLGRRAITADTALRLARWFGTTPLFWINLQARHDLDVADRTLRRKIEQGSRRATRRERMWLGGGATMSMFPQSRLSAARGNLGSLSRCLA